MIQSVDVIRCGRLATLVLAFALLSSSAKAVTIDWAYVGNPGNTADTQVMTDGTTGYGSVAYAYRISKYEVTNAQYAEFLNAVAATDTHGLYKPEMATGRWGEGEYTNITRIGSSGSYSYSAIAGRENKPVGWIPFYDALRFSNWLQNGQPTGAQDATTTEDGAYTITPAGMAANTITRNADATIFLPSEDEWYKAAYYSAVTLSYFDYPTGFNAQTGCTPPTANPNRASCMDSAGDATDVGSYTGSPSPNGTFDQGGNVFEWNEAILFDGRIMRGGAMDADVSFLAASIRVYNPPLWDQDYSVGFRVASIAEAVAEPDTGLLLVTGMLGLACGHLRASRRSGGAVRLPVARGLGSTPPV